MRSCKWETKQIVVAFSVSTTFEVPQRLTKFLEIGSSFAARGVREVACSNIFQSSYRKDKSLVEGSSSLFWCTQCAQTIDSVKHRNTICCQRLDCSRSWPWGKASLDEATFVPFLRKTSFLAFQLSVTVIALRFFNSHTTYPWPWFPLKPCLLQDSSASDTNMRISKPWRGRCLSGGKRRPGPRRLSFFG